MSPVAGRSFTATALNLAMVVVAAILVTLVWQVWTVRRSLDLVSSERMRLRALADSLRSGAVLEPRLNELERRADDLETDVSFATGAVRESEVIALRDWSRRLDSRVEANRRRIARNERALDSLWTPESSEDLSAQPDVGH